MLESNLSKRDRVLGCLLGGAVGDALGAPVEFSSLADIRRRFGPEGIRDYVPAYGRLGAITDDTQMTLFTAEGLLQAWRRGRERGIWSPSLIVHLAYQRWLQTQQSGPLDPSWSPAPLWLMLVPALRSQRAPGNTCLSALRSGRRGTIEEPINDSKGCGGVMRAAPAGLMPYDDPFRLGAETAALTHGHPSGYLAAGFLAALVAELMAGHGLTEGIEAARQALQAWPHHQECLAAVDQALDLARTAPPTAETVERLGQGWVAEEALAIALFCALATSTFEEAVALAVNHGGDSDSTGSIVGNILGTLLGPSVIPQRWLEPLELRVEIERLAEEMGEEFGL